MSSLENRAFSSTFANILLFTSHFFQAIVVVPFLLEYWGEEKYGIWLAIYAFFTLVQVFDTGHHIYVGNEFNRLYYIDKNKAQITLGSGVVMSLFVGAFELIITFLIVNADIGEKILGISDSFNETNALKGLLVLVVMWFFAGSVGGILVRIILPLGKMTNFIYLSLIIKIAHLLILISAAFFTWSIFYTCLIISLVHFIYSYCVFFYIYKIMPDFFPWWKSAVISVGWKNLVQSIIVTSNNFLEQFSTNGLIMVISNFIGANFIPAFTTMRTVTNTALQGTGMLINPIYPDMIRFHTRREYDKLRQVFITNWLITGPTVNISFVFSLVLIEPVYNWWTRGVISFDYSLYYMLVFSVMTANYNRGLVTYLSGMNQLKAMTYISVTRFIVTAGVSLMLVQLYGLLALGWALVAAELACTGWIVLFTQRLLKTIGQCLPINVVVIAALPVFIAGICLVCHSYQLLPPWIIIVLGSTSMLLIYGQLSKFISPEVRQRFKNLIIQKFQW